MNARMILAIISTLFEEAALAIIVLMGLPNIGITIPLPGLIAIMVAWAAGSVVFYLLGSQALRRKPIVGLADIVGSKGVVVRPLAPHGVVRIKSELWAAKSIDAAIEVGTQVTVVGQDGLKLKVRKED